MLADLSFQVGAVIGGIDAQFRGKAGAATGRTGREVAVFDADTGDVYDVEEAAGETLVDAATGAAGAWLLARLFRPRPIAWTRAVVAGVVATLLADLVGRSVEGPHEPGRVPHAEDPDEMIARIGAGVAIAAGYAAILYPRIPGPPLFRGLAFGALEIAAAPRGGLVRLATESSGILFPLKALALPIDEDAGPLSHLAFGIALGLLYRNGGHSGEHDD